MPARAWYDQLPPEELEEIEEQWLARRNQGVRAFTEWLATKGIEVHYSTVSRFGKRFDERLAKLQFSTRAAKAFMKANPDAEGDLAAATVKIAQSGLWEVSIALETDDPERAGDAWAKIARAQSELARADIALRRERERVLAEAGKALEREAKRRGWSGDIAAGMRQALSTV